MDETRRFAIASPATTKEINTPRVGTERSSIVGSEGMGGWKSFLIGAAELTAQVGNLRFPPRKPYTEIGERPCVEIDAYTNEAQIESHPSNSEVEQTAEDANKETNVETNIDNSKDQVVIDENLDASDEEYLGDIICRHGVDVQHQKMESLARELDAQLNAAKQAKAVYKSEMNAAKSPPVAHIKTFSTEPETEASSAKRVSSASSEGEGGISIVSQKQDFEDECTSFRAPLSPTSFFVKYGMENEYKNVRGYVRFSEKENKTRQIKLPALTPRTKSKAVLKNASILSEVVRNKHYDAIASKPSGTLDMIVSVQCHCFDM